MASVLMLGILLAPLISEAYGLNEITKDSTEQKDGLSFFMETFDVGGVVFAAVNCKDFQTAENAFLAAKNLDGIKAVISLQTLEDAISYLQLINTIISFFGYPKFEISVDNSSNCLFQWKLANGEYAYPAIIVLEGGITASGGLRIYRDLQNIFTVCYGVKDFLGEVFKINRTFYGEKFSGFKLHILPITDASKEYIDNTSGCTLSVFSFQGVAPDMLAELLNSYYDLLPEEFKLLFASNGDVWYTLCLTYEEVSAGSNSDTVLSYNDNAQNKRIFGSECGNLSSECWIFDMPPDAISLGLGYLISIARRAILLTITALYYILLMVCAYIFIKKSNNRLQMLKICY